MTSDKSILIKNIYYMLSYAFKVLKQTNYEEVAAEKFEKIDDLFAAILVKGIAQQLKQGLHRDYVSNCEHLTVMRGKIDMPGTIKKRIQRKQKISCEFDEFSEDNIYNQILKTTMHYMVRSSQVSNEQKGALKKVLVFFSGVTLIETSSIQWSRIQYQRHNRNYEMLINVCYFVLYGMLQTTEEGKYRMASFSDEHMERLFEKFILEYYKEHHSYLNEIKAGQIKWNLEGDNEETMIKFLPVMQSDVMLRIGDRVLIIDAKYYGKSLRKYYDKHSLHSANLYQIFSYVKNHDRDNSGQVSGLLIYAKTSEDIAPDASFNMGGNIIGAKTLDLNVDFSQISSQLDNIAKEYLINPSKESV